MAIEEEWRNEFIGNMVNGIAREYRFRDVDSVFNCFSDHSENLNKE